MVRNDVFVRNAGALPCCSDMATPPAAAEGFRSVPAPQDIDNVRIVRSGGPGLAQDDDRATIAECDQAEADEDECEEAPRLHGLRHQSCQVVSRQHEANEDGFENDSAECAKEIGEFDRGPRDIIAGKEGDGAGDHAATRSSGRGKSAVLSGSLVAAASSSSFG
jgi:hypothetical protein